MKHQLAPRRPDPLNELIERAQRLGPSSLRDLSRDERLFVALATDRPEILAAEGLSSAQALVLLEPSWVAFLYRRWGGAGALPARFD
jgi:hypothetical protein